MSTFDSLVADLTRDVHRVQPKDALQFCANWFQSRLEEQRTRTRDALARRSSMQYDEELPADHYIDAALSSAANSVSPFSTPHRHSYPQRSSVHNNSTGNPSPFGTLNVPGNALLSNVHVPPHIPAPPPPTFRVDDSDLSPTSNGYSHLGFDPSPTPGPGDYLTPPSATILARRTSVSAESIVVDSETDEPTPVFPKTAEQLRRIKASIANNFIFRDLDEEQETGVLNAMQEVRVPPGEVVIRQGDVGEYFYVVEDGLLDCFILPDPLPPPELTSSQDKFVQPGTHPEFGRKVAECTPGKSFGELALMYGHPRAATVLSIEPSTLWRLDRITFRTIILKAAHKRRTMYEHFLSTVPLLSSLEPEERSKIADALTSRVYADGEDVVKQGEIGDTFFFVEEGEVVVTQRNADGDEPVEVGRHGKGEYFGELSLLSRGPRAATVSAVRRTDPNQPKLKVATLEAAAFTRLLGPLRGVMGRRAVERYGRAVETYGPGYGHGR
ncbi:protein kinase A regulatory subunit [Rickenella mellea]|uniref:cAMP-dependent protein kinase regulatory subunit n=1 Tax=Rickenella mellea TaxID=50990 RepID=A0A4R5XFB6_9AGAM|nr:protein kinase A regulatory subunit [Rickenella mellea]